MASATAARRILQTAFTVVVWIGSLFLGAGRAGWTRGWISVGMYVVGMTAVAIVMKRANPELMAERAKWRRKDTKGFDKLFLATMQPLATVQPFIAGLDAVRFHWSSMGFAWVYPGV